MSVGPLTILDGVGGREETKVKIYDKQNYLFLQITINGLKVQTLLAFKQTNRINGSKVQTLLAFKPTNRYQMKNTQSFKATNKITWLGI